LINIKTFSIAFPAYVGLEKESSLCTCVISDIGDTFRIAAVLGITPRLKVEAPAIMCVKLNCFWTAERIVETLSGKLAANFSF